MEQNRRSTEALIVAILMLAMSTTALVGLGYILTTGTASGSFQTLTILLNSDPMELERDIPEGSDEPGMFNISMSTHKVDGSVTYEVEGGEAYLLVCDGSDHFTLKADSDCPYCLGLTLYEGDKVIGKTMTGSGPGVFDGEYDCEKVYKVKITSFCGLTYDDADKDWNGTYVMPTESEDFSLSFTATEI